MWTGKKQVPGWALLPISHHKRPYVINDLLTAKHVELQSGFHHKVTILATVKDSPWEQKNNIYGSVLIRLWTAVDEKKTKKENAY